MRRHRPGAPVVLVATQASRCHKHHKSSTLVVVTVISRKSTVTKILHPDRPSWLPSITFPPRKEPWHTQVGAKLIAQVFWCWQSQHLCHLEIIENLTLHINPHLPIDQRPRSLRRQFEAHAYTECSALTGLGVKDVFDEAVLAALLPR